jgi:hypothetical protein
MNPLHPVPRSATARQSAGLGPDDPPEPEPAELLSALATALELADPRAAGLLARAEALGALRDGAADPHYAVPLAELPAALAGWARRGYLPFRVKPGHCPPERRTALAAVLRALRDLPDLDCVPHWLVDGRIITLYHPGVVDLRGLMGEPGFGAEWVRATCLDSLARCAALDQTLREAVERAGAQVEPFPVAARYAAALARLQQLLGPLDLPARLPDFGPAGPAALFWDPKPANFLTPRPAPGAGPGAVVRIDLDLLHYACPLSLQVVIALFAHPIAALPLEDGRRRFDELLDCARAAGGRFAAGPAEVDAMLLYHVVRNFASALDGGPAGRAKAAAMGAVLRRICAGLTGIPPAPRAADRLAALPSVRPPEVEEA